VRNKISGDLEAVFGCVSHWELQEAQPSQPPEEPYETYRTANKHKETEHRENQQVRKKQQRSDDEHLQALLKNAILPAWTNQKFLT
jgi:hypothetical protein